MFQWPKRGDKAESEQARPRDMNDLRGQVAVITGSTSGIGLALARAVAARGGDVVLNGLGDPSEVERNRAEMEAACGVRVRYHAADMRHGEEVADMVAYAKHELGRLDILVNNAGVQHVEAIEKFPADKWEQIIAINLSSAFYATRAAVPIMKAQGRGRIINVASAHGLVASPFKSAYVAAKHGVIGLTRSMAVELGRDGITVNCICPGPVRTAMTEDIPEDHKTIFSKRRVPLRRYAEPEEVAHGTLSLVLPASGYINGVALPVDGGMTIKNA